MTTAERLKSITDRSLFERLAGRVLALKEPELANLVATGINEKGETRKSPVDAFNKISEGKYVYVEYTTDDSDLERKWLFDSKKAIPRKVKRTNAPKYSDGDLLKASEAFLAIRSTNANASLSVYLVTNQWIDKAISDKVDIKAQELGVTVKMFPGQVLSDFLDTNPTGQYLRKEFLGVEAELPSLPLLKEIAAKNLSQFKAEIYIEKATVKRPNESDLELMVNSSISSLNLLVAESGMGKSTTCVRLMESYGEENLALRIRPEHIDSSEDVLDLLHRQLSAHGDSLFKSRPLLSECLTGKRLLLVVDDINKAPNPKASINKLISWVPQITSFKDIVVHIVCPLWPRHLQYLSNKEKNMEKYSLVFLGELPTQNAVEIIQGNVLEEYKLSDTESRTVAKNLRNDPFLIGLFCSLRNKGKANIGALSNQVIDLYIEERLNEAEEMSGILRANLELALRKMGHSMLDSLNMTPSLTVVHSWLSDTERAAIQAIALLRGLFSFDSEGNISFRHDRIRDELLCQALVIELRKPDQEIASNPILSEPHYAEIIGQAMAEAKPNIETARLFLSVLPLSLYNCLTSLDSNDEYFQEVFSLLKEWNSRPDIANELKPLESWEINALLLYYDIPNVQDIIKSIPQSNITPLIIFRNGDIDGGILYLLHHLQIGPEVGNSLRDDIISHVSQKHYGRIEQGLMAAFKMEIPLITQRAAVYLLAGYWRSPKLSNAIYSSWDSETEENKHELLFYALWAIINCYDAANIDQLDALMTFWENLPTPEKDPLGLPADLKSTVMRRFYHIRWKLSDEAISALLKLGSATQRSNLVQNIFYRLDHPAALQAVVKDMGEFRKNHPDSISIGDDRWAPRNGRTLSKEGLECLKSIWTDQGKEINERKVALRFWKFAAEADKKVEHLRLIDSSDDLYRDAVFERCVAGDKSVLNAYMETVKNRLWLLSNLKFIWSSEAHDRTLELLTGLTDEEFRKGEVEFHIAEIIRGIPHEEGCKLLDACWERRGTSLMVFQSAFFLATPKFLKLAEEQLRGESKPEDKFEFIYMTMTSMSSLTPISIAQLKGLLPYYHLMEKRVVSDFFTNAVKSGYRNWAEMNLLPLLEQKDAEYWKPTKEVLLRELSNLAPMQSYHLHTDEFLRTVDERGINDDLFGSALSEFASTETSLGGFLLLGRCIEKRGKRSDVTLLQKYNILEKTLFDKDKLLMEFDYSIKRSTLR